MKVLLTFTLGAGSVGAASVGLMLNRNPQSLRRYLIQSEMPTPYSAREKIGWLTRNGFDVSGFSWRDSVIEIITTEAAAQQLQAKGAKIFARNAPAGGPGIASIDSRYLNPLRVENDLKTLAAKYPNLTHLSQIGTSLQGRPIWALMISTTPNLQDSKMYQKPSIIFDGTHHAREIMTPEIVLDIAHRLLEANQMGSRGAATMISNWNIWVVPMLNVDGNNIVWTEDHMWRKNARSDKSKTFGVDINRNYPYKWGACNGSSGSTWADNYRGSTLASEPETQALMKLGQFVQPTGSLSYHSFGELVLYPYGCEGFLSDENQLLSKIGGELASILPGDSGKGNYTPGTPWQILYAVDGDSMDYMHTEFGATALTIEVNLDFQPPYATREPTLVKHRKAWQYFVARMETHLLTIKIANPDGSPAQNAAIEISGMPHRYGEKPFHTNPAGFFFKVLDPGQYTIRVTSGGQSRTVAITMTAQAQKLEVQMGH